MKFKNFEIKELGEFLSAEILKGKDSRMRTRFVKLLNQHLTETIEAERVQLIHEYAEKDEQGELLFTDETRQFPLFTEENLAKFHQEYNALFHEEFHIEENEANKEILKTVAHVLLNSQAEMAGEKALMYDSWCEKFEEFLETQEGK